MADTLFVINSNGDLGLGTREPQYKFHVKENDNSSSPTNVEAIFSQLWNSKIIF